MTDKADTARLLQDREIDAALARQAPARALPPYDGPCMMCGDPIPQQRREAAPQARLCITCAEDKAKRKDRR